VKIAGRIADTDLEAWKSFLEELGHEARLGSEPSSWTVLDFCEVTNIGREAGEALIELLRPNVLLLNGPTAIKNMATSAGFASQILEPKDAVVAEAARVNGFAGNHRRKETS
jgi:hypothetical protein